MNIQRQVRFRPKTFSLKNSELNFLVLSMFEFDCFFPSRLNIRIDQVEEDLLGEKMKIKRISDDLNVTFDNMLSFKR